MRPNSHEAKFILASNLLKYLLIIFISSTLNFVTSFLINFAEVAENYSCAHFQINETISTIHTPFHTAAIKLYKRLFVI